MTTIDLSGDEVDSPTKDVDGGGRIKHTVVPTTQESPSQKQSDALLVNSDQAGE